MCWPSWALGIALLAAVIFTALHFSQETDFVRLIDQAQPWWLLAAALLQAGTYLAQGEIWRRVSQAAATPVSLGTAYTLSLAKLFVDQALPSAGSAARCWWGGPSSSVGSRAAWSWRRWSYRWGRRRLRPASSRAS